MVSARRLDGLIERSRSRPPLRTAVVHPCDEDSLRGACEAAQAALIVPLLVGPESRIRALAERLRLPLDDIVLCTAEHSHAAAEVAVQLARTGRVDAIMKGSLHTGELMTEVVRKETGLRTGRRMSHVFAMDVPSYPKLLFITDAAINITPTLEQKADIVQNAIELAQALGIANPKVAILSAIETVESRLPSTIDAAALCKMAERGQIRGGALEGPLALDNAINRRAALGKHLQSPVAGDADVLVAPDLEAANLLAKELSFLANADAAGIVLGARVPVMLTSRSDNVQARLASCALASLLVAFHERQRSTSA
jgi:phosphate acetyltransferase